MIDRTRLIRLIEGKMPVIKPLERVYELIALSKIPEKPRIQWKDDLHSFVLHLVLHCEQYGRDADGATGLQRLAEALIGLGDWSIEETSLLFTLIGGPAPAPALLPAPDVARGAFLGKRRALLVGVDEYPLHSGLAPLRYAAADAASVADMLLRFGGYAPEDVHVKKSRVIRDELESELSWLTDGLGELDSALLFYAGHGCRDGDGAVLALSDFVADDPHNTGVATTNIDERFHRIGRVVRFFDACHLGVGTARGGNAVESVNDRLLTNRKGWLTLAGATLTDQAMENAALGHGVFTHLLLKGLGGAAGHRRDANILVDAVSLAAFVAWSLESSRANQTPRFTADLEGLHVLTAVRCQ